MIVSKSTCNSTDFQSDAEFFDKFQLKLSSADPEHEEVLKLRVSKVLTV
jgi:hypothetical protein